MCFAEETMKNLNELFGLSGRIAVVTGASSGLGVTMARGLGAMGAKVVMAARRKERLDELAAELEKAGAEALAVGCDVSREKDVDTLVKATIDRFGGVDILVNNAGIANQAPAEEETLDDFREVMEVNLNATFLCSQRFGRVMLEAGKGSIINIASIMGTLGVGVIPQASYNASKGAVVNLTRELAAQWARRGVRVNAIGPGWFPSEMTDEMMRDEKSDRWIRRNTPMGRTGRPEELVGALILLASDASSFITGQTIYVDGGWTIV
jgi:NAD(P)-dependent dehydrogenase (short-subunit alcohol dehydrogenase family)